MSHGDCTNAYEREEGKRCDRSLCGSDIDDHGDDTCGYAEEGEDDEESCHHGTGRKMWRFLRQQTRKPINSGLGLKLKIAVVNRWMHIFENPQPSSPKL